MKLNDKKLEQGLRMFLKDFKPQITSKTIKQKKTLVLLTIGCKEKAMCALKIEEYLEEQKPSFYKIFSDETTKENEVIVHVIL